MREPAQPSILLDQFRRLCESDDTALALLDSATGVRTTRGMLVDLGASHARYLADYGLVRGQRLAVQLRNSADFVALFLASLELGLTFVPLDRDARPAEVRTVVDRFGVAAHVSLDVNGRITIDPHGDAPTHQADEPIALIKLTSGSTGAPKGVATTERNLAADGRSICESMTIRPGDRNLGAIPMSHSYGFGNLVVPLLAQGTAIITSNDYLPLSILELCNRHHCTVLPGIPMLFDHLAQLPPSDGTFDTVHTFISAGAPLAPAISRRFRERHGRTIHSFYGCSECGGIAYDRAGASVERGVAGTPMSGVRVETLEDSGRIVVASEAVAAGYLNATDEECAKFVDGRFMTDDLGTITDGEVFLTGRVSDLMNIAGKKVNPREIELVILGIDGVRDVRVWGDSAGARGDIVVAAVVADEGLTRDAIRQRCQRHLSAFKVPRIIRFLDEMPVDERGKVKMEALKQVRAEERQ